MSNKQHTLGPWIADLTHRNALGVNCPRILVDNARGSLVVAHCLDSDYLGTNGNALANARLIAAAPELLAVLDKALVILDGMRHPQMPVSPFEIEARAAIAKARGEAEHATAA